MPAMWLDLVHAPQAADPLSESCLPINTLE
jgi:hypothetical protein